MRIFLTFMFLLITYSTLFTQNNPKYALKYGENLSPNILTATVKNKKHVITKESEESCMNIEMTADFNGDGFTDALLRIINGCGGSCCGDSYQIVFYDGRNFHKSDIVGYDWDDIEIKKGKSGYTFRIETLDVKVHGTTLCNDKVETFAIKDFNLVTINTIKDSFLHSISEVRFEDFNLNNSPDSLTLLYDVNGDGKHDKFIFEAWGRWERMFWKIKLSNGKTYNSEEHYKRIGILTSKTNGFCDLVADCGDTLKWNGKKYVFFSSKR